MRDYGKVSTFFWTKGSGRRLRGDPEAQLVALYLVTNPMASSFGIYYLPISLIANDTGSPFEGASEALRRVILAGFAKYDLASETVWVPNLPKIEIGASLSGGDKRKKHLQEQLEKLGNHPFAVEFFDMYGADFGLSEPKPLRSPFDGPWEPLRSQKQKQKQDQKPKQDQISPPTEFLEAANTEFELRPIEQKPKRAPNPRTPAAPVAEAPGYAAAVDAWFSGYREIYHKDPPWGPVQGSNMKAAMRKAAPGELESLIGQFFHGPYPDTIRDGHPLGDGYACFLKRLDMLRADLTNPQRRAKAASLAFQIRNADKGAATDDVAEEAKRLLRERTK